MTITVFTSKNCTPCQEITDLIKQGKYEGEIELVDIETDEGFERFRKQVLDLGEGAVPSAYREGLKCQILITDDDTVLFNCPGDHPEGQQD
jgi:glutaredoxin